LREVESQCCGGTAGTNRITHVQDYSGHIGCHADRSSDPQARQRAGQDHVQPRGAAACGGRLGGEDSISPEITEDKAYLEKVRLEFHADDIPVEAFLAYGDPVKEIVRWVQEKRCDLLAMSTHGHRLLADIFLGATASRVQHGVSVPVLLLKAGQEPNATGRDKAHDKAIM
jgi:nucleotide-binding universal stress UspA family protein